MPPPKSFISYAWEDDVHKDWVRMLAEDLQINGVEVLLDQWDVHPGADIPNYMETSIRGVDFVILVCTPTFAAKADAGHGGVGYEKTVVTGEIFQDVASPKKFVPILRKGTPVQALPSYLKAKAYIDFREQSSFSSSLEDLLRHLHDAPAFARPTLGVRPHLKTNARANTSIGRHRPQKSPDRIMYCFRCGAVAGQKSICSGSFTSHSFTTGTGTIYCFRCGAGVGEKSICSGSFTSHSFTSGTGTIYCFRCGIVVGKKSICSGSFTSHSFVVG